MAASPARSPAGEAVPDALVQVLEILEDTHEDLSSCGPATLSLVSRTFTLLNTAFDLPSTSSRAHHLSDASTLSSALLRLCDEKINSFPYKDVPVCWRRLYTDAILLGALAALATPRSAKYPAKEKKRLEEVVKQLDMSLIIAGAPGEGREELIFALIEVAQDALRKASASTASEDRSTSPPNKKRRLSPHPSVSPSPLLPPYIARPLPSLPSLPTFLALPSITPSAPPFDPSLPHSSSFVVRSACSAGTGWPAVDRWSSLVYLQEQAGPGRVVPVEVGGDYTQAGWGQRVMPFDEFLDTLSPATPPSPPSKSSSTASLPAPPVYYLAQHSLFRQFPSLLSDLSIPDIVYSAPSTDGAGAPYEGIKTSDGYIINAWLGPAGTKSAAHTDPWWNCYVQVTGSKWVWVAPPSCSSAMAAFGASSASSSPSSSSNHANLPKDDPELSSSETAEQYMSNTSSLDVTVPPPSSMRDDGYSPSLAADSGKEHEKRQEKGYYPQAWLEQVEPLARQVVLQAGDVLIMPPGWWHAMKSLETSFSVSIWF
ncbi:hypothetical protein JCM11251_002263 [Rhodosporidiobolus azoricus]